jgi:hypothetical protein
LTDGTPTFKDAALEPVGRTVVDFQRLEHNLKLAARLAPLEGVSVRFERELDRRNEKTASMTLGQTIGAWLNIVEGSKSGTGLTPDLLDPTMRLTFSFEGFDPDGVHGETLKRLLERRNELIHGGLVNFNWESQTECERLVEELTKLNETIHSQIAFLAAVLGACKGALSDIVEYAVDAKNRG